MTVLFKRREHAQKAIDLLPMPSTFLKDMFFKNRPLEFADKVEIDLKNGNGGKRKAEYRSRNAASGVVEKNGYETNEVTPPYFNESIPNTAEDILKRLPGQTIYDNSNPVEDVNQMFMNDLKQLDGMLSTTIETQAVEAMLSGQVTINSSTVLSYGRDAGHTVTLSGADLWSASTAKIQKNIEDWRALIEKNGNANPTHMILGLDAAISFTEDSKIASLLDNRRTEVGLMKYQNLGDGRSYLGNFKGLEVFSYNSTYVDSSDSLVNFLDPKKVILATDWSEWNKLHFAVVTMKKDADSPLMRIRSERAVRMLSQMNPDADYINVQSAPLCVTHNANAFLGATVLA